MSAIKRKLQKDRHTRILDGLSSERRRILEALEGDSLPVNVRELAAKLAASDDEDRSSRTVRTALHHVDLPTLADADLIEWDNSAGVVTAAAIVDRTAPQLESRTGTDAPETVQDDSRRVVLDLLETLHGPQHVASLAEAVAAIEADTEPSPERVDALTAQLHHIHLPTLDQAGLVEYDPNAETAASTDSS